MNADEFAEALTYELGRDGQWKTSYDFPERVFVTIEDGTQFILTVERADDADPQ